jgi:hypothetical protein
MRVTSRRKREAITEEATKIAQASGEAKKAEKAEEVKLELLMKDNPEFAERYKDELFLIK